MTDAQRGLVGAVEKLYREGKGTDITLVCQGSRKPAHTAVLIARSSFFEAKVERWCNEKREIVLEGCDPEALNIVLDYMYGIDLPSMDCPKLCNILDISEMFLMADLKERLETIAIKMINKANVKELCGKADKYGSGSLLHACAQFMVEEDVCLDKEEVKKMPDVALACMEVFKVKQKNLEKVFKVKQKNLEDRLKKAEEQLRCEHTHS